MPVIVASPQDPSLTVLKLSIKQHKGGKKQLSPAKSKLFKNYEMPPPAETRTPGTQEIPTSYYVNWDVGSSFVS